LAPFAPETKNVRAGRLLLESIQELAAAHKDFGFETTLSGRTYFKLLGEMKADGYRIVFFFLWLPSPEMAVTRVENRVRQGGHGVPRGDVIRRYEAGLRNWFRLYRPIADEWWMFDGAATPPTVIAHEKDAKLVISQSRLYRRILKNAEGKSHGQG
jgi:predicted ABC-type ATPase